MQPPSVVLPVAALLLWADSLPHCTGLLYRSATLKTSQILALKNIGVRLKLADFRQTIAI
jgi:hypothetical protein